MLKYKKEKGKEKYEKPASKVLDIFWKGRTESICLIVCCAETDSEKEVGETILFLTQKF